MAGFSLDMALYNRMTGNVGNIGSLETPQPQAASQEEEKRKKQVGLMALLKKLAPKLGLNNGGPVHFARGDAVEQEEMRDLGFKWNPEQQIYEEMVPGGYYTSMSRRNAPVIDEGWMLGDPGPAPTPELTGLQIGEAQRAASPSYNQLGKVGDRGLQNEINRQKETLRRLESQISKQIGGFHWDSKTGTYVTGKNDIPVNVTGNYSQVTGKNNIPVNVSNQGFYSSKNLVPQNPVMTEADYYGTKSLEPISVENYRELHSPEARNIAATIDQERLDLGGPSRYGDPTVQHTPHDHPQKSSFMATQDPLQGVSGQPVTANTPTVQTNVTYTPQEDWMLGDPTGEPVGDYRESLGGPERFGTTITESPLANSGVIISAPPTQQAAPTPVVPAEAAEAAPEKVATGKASLFSPEEMASWTQDQLADHKDMMSRNPEMVKKGFAWNPVPEFGHYEGSWQNPSFSKGVKGWADEVIGTTKKIGETVIGDIHRGSKGLSLPYNLVSGVIDALVSPATNTRDIYSPDYEQLTSPYAGLDYANEIAVGQRGSPYGWTEGYDPDIQGPGAAYNSIEDYLKAVSLGAQTGDLSPPGEMSRSRRNELGLPQEMEGVSILDSTLADKGIGYGNWANLHLGDFDMGSSGIGTGTGPASDLGPLGDFMDMRSWGDGDIDLPNYEVGTSSMGEADYYGGHDEDISSYDDQEAMESFDSTSSGWSQGGGLASLESPERYGFGGNILSTLGRIGGTMFLTPFLGPIGASAASSGAVSMLEGKGLKESATDAAISGLMSFGTGKLFGTDMMSDVGQTPVSDVAKDFGMSVPEGIQPHMNQYVQRSPVNSASDLFRARATADNLSDYKRFVEYPNADKYISADPTDYTVQAENITEGYYPDNVLADSDWNQGIGEGAYLGYDDEDMVSSLVEGGKRGSVPLPKRDLQRIIANRPKDVMRMRDIYRVGAEEVGRQAFYPEFEEEEIEEREEYIMPRRQRARPRPRRTTGRTFYDWKLGGAIDKYATGGGAKRGGIGQLTPGDFVISADVVSNVGDGSSEFGANRIEEEFGINDMENSYNRAGVVNTGLSGMVRGPGSGLDDLIQTTIAGKRAARLANQEVVVPKNVVRSIGGGDITQGQEKLYNFMDNVRKQKHGTSQQPTALKGSLSSLMG